jgi:hypothetical protein
MKRTRLGVGYIGTGIYKGNTKCKVVWNSMLERCYDKKLHERMPCYIGCSVHPDWHNFQNFAKWYEENFDPIKHKGFQLDKDLLVPGNKVYGPDTCCFVPPEINYLFINRGKNTDLPIGVAKSGKKFTTRLFINSKETHLGTFNTPEEASEVYKTEKKKRILELCEKFKDSIPNSLYITLINYKL